MASVKCRRNDVDSDKSIIDMIKSRLIYERPRNWSGFSDLNPRWSGWPDDKRKRFRNDESDYNYVCRASELGSPKI